MFWFLAVLLAGLVTIAVVWPLVQRRETGTTGGRDLDVYAAQLDELHADLGRGAIGEAEARTARAEIGRRLLRAAARTDAQGRSERGPAVAAGLVVALAMPALAFVFYAQTGQPGRADLPLAARAAPPTGDTGLGGGNLSAMIAAAEARLQENPQDGQGWEVLAPVYARMGDLPRAETAYRNALALLGDSAQRLTGYGEVQVRAAGGEVTEAARAAFARASELDPQALMPRLFLALDLTQDGRSAEAADAWRALLAEAPEEAPWRPMAVAALAEAEGRGPAPTPSQAEVVERAAAMPQEGQAAMIEGMVSGLARRLEAEPRDAEGWMRLVQAYGVLGDEEKGQAALESARRTFGTQTEEWARIADVGARAGFVVSSEARP